MMRSLPSRIVRLVAWAVLIAAVLGASPARAGDFMDLRLSFNLTDENVLVKPGETTPSIPGPRIGAPIARWGTLFFDNYDTRFTGFENLTNLVLYKSLPVGQADFEAALVLRFNQLSDNLSSLYDAGSYVRWVWWFDPKREGKNNVSITAFPLSSDPFRLGYSYKISWGGSPIFFKPNPDNPFASTGSSNPAPAPGARVQYATENAYAFAGVKTSLLLNRAINEQTTIYGVLAGAGIDVLPQLRIEANGGYFYRGGNPKQEVLGQAVDAYGASGQVVWHQGVPVGRSIDYALYRNDPSATQRLFAPEEYPGGITWLVSTEGTFTQQVLQDPDRASSTTRQTGVAADLNFRMKIDKWRLHADFLYEDLAYLLTNVPSFVPFQAISTQTAHVTPQTFAAIGADYFFKELGLTLGATGGVQMPATFTGNLPTELAGNFPSEALPTSSTVVVRSEGLFDILPPKKSVLPIVQAKLTAMFRWGGFGLLGELLLGIDNNSTHLIRPNGPETVPQRVFTQPYQVGFNIALQARL